MKTSRVLATLILVAVAGCHNGKDTGADTTLPTGAPSSTPPSAAPSTSAPSSASTQPNAPAAAGAPQAITGKTWDVKMIGDNTGYHFDPASLTIKRGDGVRFTVISGPPHNVTFWADSIPSGAQSVLQGNMSGTTAPLTGPLLLNPSQTYTVSFGGAPAGTYKFYCTPHLALGMKGVITVQ